MNIYQYHFFFHIENIKTGDNSIHLLDAVAKYQNYFINQQKQQQDDSMQLHFFCELQTGEKNNTTITSRNCKQ